MNRIVRLRHIGAMVGALAALSVVPAAQTPQAPATPLRLAGAANFRDLGGYQAADGRRVRYGKIYRSSDLSRVTPEDSKILGTLGLVAICDYRQDSERNAAPDVWNGPNRPLILAMPPTGTDTSEGVADMASKGATVAELQAAMRQSYARYIDTLTPQFRTVLQIIQQTGGAVLFHCSAGKDRSGTFAALLLTMLGVPRDTVFQDYLLSNQRMATDQNIAGFAKRINASPDAVRVILSVDASYLQIIFDSINQKFSSFDNYRRVALGISDADLTALRNRLLQ